MIASVVFPQGWCKFYDYSVPAEILESGIVLSVGSVVKVNLRQKESIGVVFNIVSDDNNKGAITEKLSPILSVLSYKIPESVIGLVKFVAEQNFVSWGSALKLVSGKFLTADLSPLPVYAKDKVGTDESDVYTIEKLNQHFAHNTWKKALKDGKLSITNFKQEACDHPFTYLTPDQEIIANKLEHALDGLFLLEGSTGSGKTDVYLEVIGRRLFQAFEKGQSGKILILVPEISLTTSFLNRFKKRFGLEPLIWHHKTSETARKSIFAWALDSQDSGVIIGARSALFLPFANLKMIVMDEEHDSTYKQGEGIRYNSKECVEFLSQQLNIPTVFVSATPSLEYFLKGDSDTKRYTHLKIERQQQHGHAKVEIVDMRKEKNAQSSASRQASGWLSNRTVECLKENFKKGEMSMLFLNRKGYSPLVVCAKCGNRVLCPSCSVGLVFYKSGEVKCHYCGYYRKLEVNCGVCTTPEQKAQDNYPSTWIFVGPGIERLAQIVQELIPEAKIATASSDITKAELIDLHDRINKNDIANRIDILIGTQILAQGHHIERLSFVCIVDCDFGLGSADYQASERTYQMLTQVRGRAGRGDIPGHCILQTFCPDHPLIQHFAKGELEAWLPIALEERKTFHWPPYCNLLAIIIESNSQNFAQAFAQSIKKELQSMSAKLEVANIELLGPTPAPVFKLKQSFRYRFLFKYHNFKEIEPIVSHIIEKYGSKQKNVKILIDNLPESFI